MKIKIRKYDKKVCKILVTTALPYSNGFLHLGHIFGCIVSDIFVRFNRYYLKEFCVHICGDDSHGTPIMLNAKKNYIFTSNLIFFYYESHKSDLISFNIEYDNYSTTHSKENEDIVHYVYKKLLSFGYIGVRKENKLFDSSYRIFLPDRYVKGVCPRCFSKGQFGDGCGNCGLYYSSKFLINPVSILSNTIPKTKETLCYFFRMNKFIQILNNWLFVVDINTLAVKKKLNDWLRRGLCDWEISREYPYFGIKVPNIKKYFYVWLDAPFGYTSSFLSLCLNSYELLFNNCWEQLYIYDLISFIGKDIVYFHTLFWPALLCGSSIFRVPRSIICHGFLNNNNLKMSKSKGIVITARSYLQYFDPDFLRYYFASKIFGDVSDVSFNGDEFIIKSNTDIIGKYLNIASRISFFLDYYFDNNLSFLIYDQSLFTFFINQLGFMKKDFQLKKYYNIIKRFSELVNLLNRLINFYKPWSVKSFSLVHILCTFLINLFKVISFFIKPIIPKIVRDIEIFLNIDELTIDNYFIPLLNHSIKNFKPFLRKIDISMVKCVFKYS